MRNDTRSLPFIKSIRGPESVEVGKQFTIEVDAEWPTPAWKHTDTKVHIDENTKTIVVDYYGQSAPGMAIMVIKPFSFSQKLAVPAKGEWIIRIRGRSGDKIHKVKAS